MKVLAVAGSSGGHIYPAISFLDALNEKRKNMDTLLVLPRKNITSQIENFNYRVNYISVSSVKLSLDFKNFIAIVNFLKGSLESMLIFLLFRPDIIVGFGSLASVPMVLFGRLFGAKVLIHEQNVIPGRANRFLAKFADRIAVSFSGTKGYFEAHKTRVALTGFPLRKGLAVMNKNAALDFFGFDERKFTLLVIGGSQGSHRINLAFLKSLPGMTDISRIQVIHITGARDYDLLKAGYKDLNVNSRLFGFLSGMQYAYSACDLVISRAGAAAISELIFFGLPAILIPYPFAYRHQAANARVLEKAGSAIIIDDERLDSGILLQNIENLINNPDKIKAMRGHYNNVCGIKSCDLLANEALSICPN